MMLRLLFLVLLILICLNTHQRSLIVKAFKSKLVSLQMLGVCERFTECLALIERHVEKVESDHLVIKEEGIGI
jgi:hypothetical protein